MKHNNLKTGIKYFIKDLNNKVSCILEHEFKHYLRHNDLRSSDYNVAGFSSIINGYLVYVTKPCNKYKGKRIQIKK